MNLIEAYEAEGRIIRIPFSGCWIWLGSLQVRGYGQISGGRLLHRVAWEIFRGDIPAGKMVCHHCDVKCCVNPDHLFVGTHRDNVVDAIAKGKYAMNGSSVTHCHRGHEFTEENTYNWNGHRHCKSCWKLKYKNK